jgi:hypothetical protein
LVDILSVGLLGNFHLFLWLRTTEGAEPGFSHVIQGLPRLLR